MTYPTQVKHWPIALALGFAGMLAVLLLMPYLFVLLPGLAAKIHIPLPLFVLAQTLQAGAMFVLLGWVGLWLGYPFGLDSPWLRQWLRAGPSRALVQHWLNAIVLGLAVGAICIFFEILSRSFMPQSPADSANAPNWWQGLLASFYGGISEEVLSRLFLVSLLVWFGARLRRTATPGDSVYWTAIVISAIVFGAGHLPALSQIHPLNFVNVTYTIGLNAICGVAFGWLFWRRGLEHAMLGHFSADIVLHVLAPLGVAA